MDHITGMGRRARHGVLIFTKGTLSTVRVDDFRY